MKTKAKKKTYDKICMTLIRDYDDAASSNFVFAIVVMMLVILFFMAITKLTLIMMTNGH